MLPSYLTIKLPEALPYGRGRRSTAMPHGYMGTFRGSESDRDLLDAAVRALNDPNMTRSMFIRIAAISVANEIVNQSKGKNDERQSELPGIVPIVE